MRLWAFGAATRSAGGLARMQRVRSQRLARPTLPKESSAQLSTRLVAATTSKGPKGLVVQGREDRSPRLG
jgi:hypothetical protein